MKKASIAASVVVGLLGTLIGALLIIVPVDLLIKIFFIVFGVLTLISGIPQLVFSIANIGSKPKEAIFDMILAIITIIAGLILIFVQSTVIMIVVGAYLIVLPLIRVIFASEKFAQLKKELPTIILGIIMVIVGPADVIKILFDIAGIVVIVLSLAYMIVGIVGTLKKSKKSYDSLIYVEATEISDNSEETENK